MVQTGITHPLRIDDLPLGNGRLTEGADIITRLVRDNLRLEHEHDGAEQLARAYPGA